MEKEGGEALELVGRRDGGRWGQHTDRDLVGAGFDVGKQFVREYPIVPPGNQPIEQPVATR